MKLFSTTSLDDKITRRAKWKVWFAWHPVPVDGGYVWLEFVDRRRLYDFKSGGLFFNPAAYWKTEYRRR